MADALKILICDDSILARKQLTDAIKKVDIETSIIEAKNGKECVEMFEAERPNIVFIDIVMPVLDGVSAVKGIIAIDPGATVIIVSSVGTHKELKAAIEAGAHDFIQKPFSQDQIKEVIGFYTLKQKDS